MVGRSCGPKPARSLSCRLPGWPSWRPSRASAGLAEMAASSRTNSSGRMALAQPARRGEPLAEPWAKSSDGLCSVRMTSSCDGGGQTGRPFVVCGPALSTGCHGSLVSAFDSDPYWPRCRVVFAGFRQVVGGIPEVLAPSTVVRICARAWSGASFGIQCRRCGNSLTTVVPQASRGFDVQAVRLLARPGRPGPRAPFAWPASPMLHAMASGCDPCLFPWVRSAGGPIMKQEGSNAAVQSY